MLQKLILQKAGYKTCWSNPLLLFLVIILYFLIKSYIVKVLYNNIGPKIMYNFGSDENKFRLLTFQESMAFTLLTNCLFR